jgi:hypothetical protein
MNPQICSTALKYLLDENTQINQANESSNPFHISPHSNWQCRGRCSHFAVSELLIFHSLNSKPAKRARRVRIKPHVNAFLVKQMLACQQLPHLLAFLNRAQANNALQQSSTVIIPMLFVSENGDICNDRRIKTA